MNDIKSDKPVPSGSADGGEADATTPQEPVPQIVIDQEQPSNNGKPKKTKKAQASNAEIMVKANDEHNRKTDEQTADISNSKDKAQATANTALSLTMIAVLKRLIEEGPSGYKYFKLNMVLVSLSLFFQIVIGVSTLVMHQLQGEANKLKKRKPSGAVGGKTSSPGNDNKGFKDEKNPGQTPIQNAEEKQDSGTDGGNSTPNMVSVVDNTEKPHTDGLETAEQQENKGQDIVSPPASSVDPVSQKPEKPLVSLRGILGSQSEETLQEYYNQLCDEIFHPEDSEDDEDEDDLKARAKLNRKKELLQVLDSQIRAWQKRNLLTKISRVQHVITYLTYIIFILNTFITGFGMA